MIADGIFPVYPRVLTIGTLARSPHRAIFHPMAILKIARMGHPVLGTVAKPVSDPKSAEIRNLVNDMVETMRDANGAGLAAVPVGMTVGMQFARSSTVTSAVFVTDRRTRAGVIVDDRAVRVWGSSAGPAEAACSDEAFSDGAGGENGASVVPFRDNRHAMRSPAGSP